MLDRERLLDGIRTKIKVRQEEIDVLNERKINQISIQDIIRLESLKAEIITLNFLKNDIENFGYDI